MKKIIRLTESDLENIVKRVITEQTEERNFVKGVQEFLNTKKITGDDRKPLVVDGKTDNNMTSQTAKAISKYQQMIGVSNIDGVFGPETWEKMSIKDKQLLKNLIAKHGGWIDKFLNWIGL